MTKNDLSKVFALKSIPRKLKRGRRTMAPTYMAGDGHSCLYAIGAEGHGFVKFGRSTRPYERMSDHQVSSPFVLFMLTFIEARHDSVVNMETELIRALSSGRYEGMGEWWSINTKAISPLFSVLALKLDIEIVKQVGMTDVDDADELESSVEKCGEFGHPGRRVQKGSREKY